MNNNNINTSINTTDSQSSHSNLYPRTVEAYRSIVDAAMTNAIGYTPRPFQTEVVSHILHMKPDSISSRVPQANLLVQGTGGGKSSVYQCIGAIKRGIHIVVQNTLALSSDQMSKVDKMASNGCNVKSLQLDNIKSTTVQRNLVDSITTYYNNTSNNNLIFFIFTSPECLQKKIWNELFEKILLNGSLKMICFDEVHLFVQFAISFRPSFISLRKSIFNKLLLHSNSNNCTDLKIPILFMTATFNIKLFELLQKMTGIRIKKDNIFWSNGNAFQRRNISIDVSFTFQKFKQIKLLLEDRLKGKLNKKSIIYSSIATSVEKIQNDLDSWLDEPTSLRGDTIIINGKCEPEWKLVATQEFSTVHNNPSSLIRNNKFFPRILVATSGCIGAGLDSPDVYLVVRDGFPSSLLDLIQEMGRCARGSSNETNNNHSTENAADNVCGAFDLILYTNSLEYMILRIHSGNEDGNLTTNELNLIRSVIEEKELIKWNMTNLLSVLKLTFLETSCWHLQLENISACPDIFQQSANNNLNNEATSDSCLQLCPYCNNSMSKYVMTVDREKLTMFLVETFERRMDLSYIHISTLIECLRDYDNVGKLIYRRSTSTAPASRFLHATILQLIAAEIIHIDVVKVTINRNETNKIVLKLKVIDDIGSKALNVNTYWSGINCFAI